MVPDPKPLPEKSDVARHLAHITRRWDELGEPALLEVVFLTPEDKARVHTVMHFDPDETGLALAVESIVGMNEHQLNAYATVNPVNANNRPAANKRASREHILASFYHWADADDETGARNIKEFVGPKPTFYVITGRSPTPRPHVYWELEDPTRNLDAWEKTQRNIAATLKTDRQVVDPPRIMRIAGTVNWPKPQKLVKGYRAEICTLRIYDEDERPPVTSERMARAFARAQDSASIEIDTGDHDHKTADDYAEILKRAQTDGEKHGGVRDLAASLAGQGVSRALAEAIIRQACPVWDRNVEDLIGSAYEKFYVEQVAADFGWTPPPPDAPPGDEDATPTWPTPLTEFDELSLPRREWVYGHDYIRGYLSVLAAAPGASKTSNAIVEALAIVTGRPLLGVEVKEQTKVWLCNLEDPRSEVEMRVLAAMKHYRIHPDEVRGKLFIDGEDTIQMCVALENRDGIKVNDALLDYMTRRVNDEDIGVCIIDPFVSTHMVNENSNAAIQAVVAAFRTLARNTHCAVLLIHHTRKGNGEDATIDSVRGAGAIVGAARAARIVNKISEKNAEAIGMTMDEARSIFRIDDGKQNLAPPADKAVYRKMIGVQLANGEWVGVSTPFELPDEWAGMSDHVVNEILSRIDRGLPDAPGEEFYSLRPQDKGRWVGKVITDFEFGNADHVKTAAQAKAILRQWLKTGLIEEMEYRSTAQRKDRKGVLSTGRVGGDQ